MENQKQVINIGDLVYTESESTPDYLTKGKEYVVLKVIDVDDNLFAIQNDLGRINDCLLKGCAHLYGDNWIIKKP